MPSPVFRTRAYVAVVVFALAGLFLMCRQPKWQRAEGLVWTTEYHISYAGPAALRDSIDPVLQRVDASASVYNPKSLISAINSNTSSVIDPILTLLLNTSKQVHRATGGAFDPTVMPLVNAWGFGYTRGTPPTDAQIDSILQFVGLDKVSISNGHAVKTDPRVQLDFSSIAKGLACDEVGAMLSRGGAKNYLVEIGGEVVTAGVNEQGRPWHVSVDLPSDQADTVMHNSAVVLRMPAEPRGVATSGNYRKYIESGGTRRSHIINPRTGRSAESDLLSVTVVAPSCMLADAWATALMVLGTESTRRMTENNDTLGVLTISAWPEGQLIVWSNAAFARLVEPQ